MVGSVLRNAPPWSTCLEVLQLISAPTDFQQPFELSTLNINEQTVENIAVLLYPYYYESSAYQYLDTITGRPGQSIITILRQILRPHGYLVKGTDTTSKGVHKIIYRIVPTSSATTLPAAVQIAFN